MFTRLSGHDPEGPPDCDLLTGSLAMNVVESPVRIIVNVLIIVHDVTGSLVMVVVEKRCLCHDQLFLLEFPQKRLRVFSVAHSYTNMGATRANHTGSNRFETLRSINEQV